MRMNLGWALAALLGISTGTWNTDSAHAGEVYSISDTSATTSDGTTDCACGLTTCGASACSTTTCLTDCEPRRLFPEFGCGWQLHGWLNGSASANADAPASHLNGPVTMTDRDGFSLNQAYMILERGADYGGCGVAWGGRVDVMFGSDYIFTQAAGLETHQNGTPHWNGRPNYGVALPQAYIEVAYNNLSMKLGHFYTIIGYQGVMATSNFFPSQPYTFQYGEPFTHTGALATYKNSDQLTTYAGLVNGWDKLDALTDMVAVIGGAAYTPAHERYSLLMTGIVGEEDGIALPIQGTRAMYSLVLTYNMTDDLQYVFQHDNGWQENGVGAGIDAEWYGINQYLFYTVNDCWKLGGRFEWFRDDDGVRVSAGPVRAGGMGAFGNVGLPASAAGNYFAAALGANWTPRTNLNVRPELRWDWSDGTTARPFDDGTKDSQFIATVDAILTF